MDKSFNDQELSDIMKEIEALEEDFQQEGEKPEATPVMKELSEMEESKAVPASPQKSAQVISMPKSPVGKTAMSFKVEGQMNLELRFDISGTEVCLEVCEEGLHIEMAGGVTFSVPVKKAA